MGISGTDADLAAHIDEGALIELTRALVRLRTVNEPSTGSSETPAAELVAATMRGFGWEPEIVDVEPGRPNVIAIVDGGAPGRTLMFEGHTDVVTEGDRAAWSFDPYGAELHDGRVHGRGSADMKSGLAAMLHAARAVELAGSFPGRIVVAALVDEEGLMLGAKHFARTALAAEIDGVIVCEPEGGEVCATAKGAIRVRVDVTGVMAHGAMPQHGRNPLPAIAEIVTAMEQTQQRLQDTHGEDELLGWCYVTPTVLEAGNIDQINVIPAHATLAVDVRTIPGVDHNQLIKDIRTTADEASRRRGLTATVQVIDDRPAVVTPRDHPVVAAVAAAHEAVTGQQAAFGGVPGATDGTVLSRDAGLATVVYGPGGKWIAHQADEFVEVADIVQSARVYAEAARIFLTGTTGDPA